VAGSGEEHRPKSNLVNFNLNIWHLVATILISTPNCGHNIWRTSSSKKGDMSAVHPLFYAQGDWFPSRKFWNISHRPISWIGLSREMYESIHIWSNAYVRSYVYFNISPTVIARALIRRQRHRPPRCSRIVMSIATNFKLVIIDRFGFDRLGLTSCLVNFRFAIIYWYYYYYYQFSPP